MTVFEEYLIDVICIWTVIVSLLSMTSPLSVDIQNDFKNIWP